MRTQTETIVKVIGHKITAKNIEWREDYYDRPGGISEYRHYPVVTTVRHSFDFPARVVKLEDEDGNIFWLPVTKQFMEQLIPGKNQRVEMEIRICQ